MQNYCFVRAETILGTKQITKFKLKYHSTTGLSERQSEKPKLFKKKKQYSKANVTHTSGGLILTKITARRSLSSCVLSSSKDKSFTPGFTYKKNLIRRDKIFYSTKVE